MTCHACGAQLSATARFCHKCGAAVGRASSIWRTGLPWGIAGAALGALVTVVVMRGSGAESRDQTAPSSVRAPDISQMSPEERATRLFNRVMLASEAGKMDSVRFFLPMAISAYQQLPSLDLDSRFHLGQLYVAGNQAQGALAQADTILRSVPTHLFAFMLRADAYRSQGNTALARRAYGDFLRNQATELARGRSEYEEHRNLITDFAAEARRP